METNTELKNETVKVEAAEPVSVAAEVKDTPNQPVEPTPTAENKPEQSVPSIQAPKPVVNAPVVPSANAQPQARAASEPKPDKHKALVAAVEAMLEKYKLGHTVKSNSDYKYPGMSDVANALSALKG